MTSQIRWPVTFSALVVAFGVASAAAADPPSRVARLSYLTGSVSFRPATLDDWGPVTLNYPLTTGDHLWTDEGAQAELHVGASVIRLAPETAFSFLNLDDRTVQVRLAEGSLDVHVRDLGDDEAFEIDTPGAAVSLLRPGVYRVDVQPDGREARVTVRDGQAEVAGSGTVFTVYAGQVASLSGTDYLAYDIDRAGPLDGWERWCRDRDVREDRSLSLRYVSRDYIGYEDLDDYGTWRSVPEYGDVWQPTVVRAGWAPYRHGHWAWVEPWGWTWIDAAPWGFAPFHYGRWAYVTGIWVWVPGRGIARPVYAPALVAFVGGHDWSFSFAFGVRPAVAWFPLAPGEIYVPAYHVTPGYLRNVNVTNVNITSINVASVNVRNVSYANRAVTGAVTAVPRDAFVTARGAAWVSAVVSPRVALQSAVVGATAPVAPGAESVLPRTAVAVPRPSATVQNRVVAVRSTPPPQPAPFAARERALAAQPGQSLGGTAPVGTRGSAAVARQTAPLARPANLPRSDLGPAEGSAAPSSSERPLGSVARPRVAPGSDRPGQAASPADRSGQATSPSTGTWRPAEPPSGNANDRPAGRVVVSPRGQVGTDQPGVTDRGRNEDQPGPAVQPRAVPGWSPPSETSNRPAGRPAWQATPPSRPSTESQPAAEVGPAPRSEPSTAREAVRPRDEVKPRATAPAPSGVRPPSAERQRPAAGHAAPAAPRRPPKKQGGEEKMPGGAGI